MASPGLAPHPPQMPGPAEARGRHPPGPSRLGPEGSRAAPEGPRRLLPFAPAAPDRPRRSVSFYPHESELRGREGEAESGHEREDYQYPPSSENQAARRFQWFDVKSRRARPGAVAEAAARRDRIVVSTLRCGRSNLGSNPSHGSVVCRT